MKRVAFFIPHEGCPRKCIFCDQNAISGKVDTPTLLDIEKTLERAKDELGDSISSTQIAFFGGSFTAINKEFRDSILDVAASFCGKDGFSGIRFSTRPDCISEEILKGLERYPIAHIELGAQSMNDDVLYNNKRGHTAKDTINASTLIKQAGYFQTLQMMIGLYKDSWDRSISTAYEIASMMPEEVRIYPTLVLKDTQLAQLYYDKKYYPLGLSSTIKICAEMLEIFSLNNIKVIRMGLHSDSGLKDQFVAGPYHPALRELAEGYRMYNKALDIIEKNENYNKDITLIISPYDLSKIKGHGGWILSLFQNKGYFIKVKTSDKIPRGEIQII